MEGSVDENVLTHFPRIGSRFDGTFDVSGSIFCIHKYKRALKIQFKGFAVPCLSLPTFSREKYKDNLKILFSLFKENVHKPEFQITNLQTGFFENKS